MTLAKDAVWGPTGSPYVVGGQVKVKPGFALTLLPGTVVKFATQSSRLVIQGQLLSLGSPKSRVTFTSIKDDSVGGDTNGDGSATSPARGDWTGIFVYSEAIGTGGEEVNPVSAFDYTDFTYGGYTSAVNCQSGAMLEVATPNGRAIVTNSTFRGSYRAGIGVGAWTSLRTDPYRGFVGVYGNKFFDSECGVSMAEGDIAGNHFAASLSSALFSNSPGDVDFRHNVSEAPVISAAGNGVTFRFNELTTRGQYGAANQQTGDYRWNYWGSNPPSANALGSAPPQFLPDSITRAYHPTYGPVDTGLGALNYAAEDLVVNDAGKSLVAGRTYSSHPESAAGDADLGRGWRSSFSEALSRDGSGALTMETADGAQMPFGSATDSGQSDNLGVAAGISTGATGSSVTSSDNTTYEFDSAGQLTSMVLDDPGHKVNFDRVDGRIAKATGVSGRFLAFTRSGGRLQVARDSQDRQVGYAYTGGLLTSATGVDAKAETYTYGAGDRLTKVTSASGQAKVAVGYDTQGRVEWVEQGAEGRATIGYGEDRRTITRADGVQVVQDLDSYGRLAVERVGDIASHVIYDADGREIMRVDGVPSGPMDGYSPSSPATIFSDRGDAIWQIDEVGRGTRTFFNSSHKPTRIRDLRGGTTSYTYGDQGRVTSITDPREGIWQVEHNTRGQVTRLTDPVGRLEIRSYEPDGDPAAVTNIYAGETTFATDALGRVTSRTDPQNQVARWVYTSWGAVSSHTIAAGTTTVAFDADRRPTTVTDPRGEKTISAYDTRGRLESSTNAAAGVTGYGYDVLGRLSAVTDPLGRVTNRQYNPQSLITRETGPEGARSDTEYDPSGRAVWVTDALGAITQHVVDRSGRVLRTDYPDGGSESFTYGNGADITAYTNPLAGAFTYTYDKAGNLVQSKSPLAGIEKQTYDVLGRPLVTTDARGNSTTLAYSNAGRTTTATDALGAVSVATTDTSGRVVTETDGLGRDTTYTYDGAGRVLTRTAPGQRVSTYDYDAAGNPIAETTPTGRKVIAVLDALGRPTKRTYADASTELFGYDAVGNLITQTDRNAHTSTYKFDGLNRVTTETDPLGGIVAHTWDTVGNETSTTDPTGVATTTAYDPMGRPAVVSNSAGAYTQLTYDKLGNPLTVRNPAGGITTRIYDKVGRTTSEALPANSGTTTFGYDLNDNVTSSKRGLNALTWAYDSRNRPVKEVDRRGNATISTYNAADQLTTRKTPTGSTTTNTYDPTGRLASSTNHTGQATSYTWTKDDQLASLTLPRGGGYDWTYDQAGHRRTETVHTGTTDLTTTFTHDPLGNLTATAYPSGRQVSATFDALGRPKAQTAGATTRAYAYDAAGRLTSATRTNAPALSYAYDNLGRRTSSTDHLGTTTFAYDNADRVTTVTPPAGQTANTFTYNAADQLATMRGGANLNYTFASTGTLTNRTSTTGTAGANVSYTYDADNNPLTVTSGNAKIAATYNPDGKLATQTQTLDGLENPDEGTTSYEYDANNRLGAATTSRGGVEVNKRGYAWDGDNNRSTATTRNGDATAPTNQTDSTFDKAGRLLSTTGPSGATTYNYDPDGQLTAVDAPGAAADLTHTYDGFGELASTTTGTGTSAATATYTRDALSRVAGWNTPGSATQFGYTSTSDEPTSVKAGPQTTQLVRDAYGALISARTGTQIAHAATNTHGDQIAWRATNSALITSTLFDPFGQPTTTHGPGAGPGKDIPLGYESHLTLPGAGLVDLGSRSYNPTTGTFTSQDVVIGDLTAPVSLNRYTYAFGDPINFTDPTGYWPDWLDEAATAVKETFSDGVDKAKETYETVASNAPSASEVVSTVSSLASTATSSTARALQGAKNFIAEHKIEIISTGAGIGVGLLCTALTSGGGAVPCAMAGGAVTGLVANHLDPNADHSASGRVGSVLWGAGGALAGHGLGKLVAPAVSRFTAPLRAHSEKVLARGKDGIAKIREVIFTRLPARDERGSSDLLFGLFGKAADDAANAGPALANYRGRYSASLAASGAPRLPRDWDAHHRIPQMYRDHPDFADFDFDAPSNIVGLPGNRVGVGPANVHNQVTQAWNEFAAGNPNAGREAIESFAGRMDAAVEGFQWR